MTNFSTLVAYHQIVPLVLSIQFRFYTAIPGQKSKMVGNLLVKLWHIEYAVMKIIK